MYKYGLVKMAQDKILKCVAMPYSIIDWENAKRQILTSFMLTDSEVETCLAALEHARELYPNCFDVPERISLTNNKGYVLHTILTRGGKPTTVYVKPKGYSISGKLVAALVTAAVAGAFVYYYYD